MIYPSQGRYARPRHRSSSHPSSPSPHLQLADLVFDSTGTWLPNELEAAIWLDPNDPAGRDRYVQALVSEGKQQEALSQISTSVYLSPSLGSHAYLSPRLMPWLSVRERAAVESGLRAAVAHGYEGSVDSLAQFYSVEGRELAAAGVYEDAAHREQDTSLQLHYWLAAGEAYARAGKRDKAQQLFTAATELAPDDPRPYRDLIGLVYGPEKDFSSANKAIQSAMSNGINPVPLYLSLGAGSGSGRGQQDCRSRFAPGRQLRAFLFKPDAAWHAFTCSTESLNALSNQCAARQSYQSAVRRSLLLPGAGRGRRVPVFRRKGRLSARDRSGSGPSRVQGPQSRFGAQDRSRTSGSHTDVAGPAQLKQHVPRCRSL